MDRMATSFIPEHPQGLTRTVESELSRDLLGQSNGLVPESLADSLGETQPGQTFRAHIGPSAAHALSPVQHYQSLPRGKGCSQQRRLGALSAANHACSHWDVTPLNQTTLLAISPREVFRELVLCHFELSAAKREIVRISYLQTERSLAIARNDSSRTNSWYRRAEVRLRFWWAR
jgi:hypothetical protein